MGRIVLNISPESDSDGICEAQTHSSGGTQNLTINGELSFSGTVSFISPHIIIITSVGNDSSRTFSVSGTDVRGATISESITGGNASSVVTSNYFKTVTGIVINGNSSGELTAGVDGRSSSNWGAVDTTGVNIGFGCVMSTGGNFTYSMQHTFGDVQNLKDTEFYWFDQESLVDKTDNQDGNYAFGFTACRAVITAYTSGTLEVSLVGAER